MLSMLIQPLRSDRVVLMTVLFILLSQQVYALPEPAPVHEYLIHEDGGLVYDPQRQEAERTGQLASYDNAVTTRRGLKLGPYRLSFTVPKQAIAYDVVPIRYELSWDTNQEAVEPEFPVAVEAVAFEDETRRQGRNLFDLALPGDIDLDVEYLGSITAHLKPNARHNLEPDMSDKPMEYPGFERKPLVHSGVVEAGDLVWFRFRYTNTGNTILDAEGFGGYQLYPHLLRKNSEGKYELIGEPHNLYYRDLEYLYPGESHETWIHFATHRVPSETPQNFGLISGEYLLQFRLTYRCYKKPDIIGNMWDGPTIFVWEMPFSVEPEPRHVPIAKGRKVLTDMGSTDKITRFIHTFEEFMTAFDCHLARPTGERRTIRGKLHLQVAPWTKDVVVKLVGSDPVSVVSTAVPVAVDSDSLSVTFNRDMSNHLIKNGLREPIIASQTMAEMRTNVQLGPFPEYHIHDRLQEMMDCGINVVATTATDTLYRDRRKPKSNYQGDAYKYFMDVAREEGMRVEGWGAYPFNNSDVGDIAVWITGREFQGEHDWRDYAEPLLPLANATVWLYQFHRWGDLYYQNERGDVPIGTEDLRGWMRYDIDTRFPIGEMERRAFHNWVKKKYGTIETTNASWNSTFGSFEEIDPQKGQVENRFGHRWEYTNPLHPFHDWNQAVVDLDEFRTELRVQNYRDVLAIIRKEIPTAMISLRTEASIVLISGIDPTDPNPHLRHIYYSQRRTAAIAEIIQKSGLVKFHCDYQTIPYTPSELRQLVCLSVSQGIIPMYLPYFNDMRDVVINDRYGKDYQVDYNISNPKKGYVAHCLVALYPWFKTMYEEGGIPGILWEDYQCVGFATETQKKEMRLFMKKLTEAISTPQAIQARTTNLNQPLQGWRKRSQALPSYRLTNVWSALKK